MSHFKDKKFRSKIVGIVNWIPILRYGWNPMCNIIVQGIRDSKPGALCFNPGTFHFE